MALRWADKTVEESTTTTTGAYQLGGVPSGSAAGSQTFVAGVGDGNTCYYEAEEVGGSAYERGLGTVTDAATDTLARTRIDASSNGGAAVDWTGKTVRIYCTMPAHAIRRAVLDSPSLLENCTIVCTRTGNAETFHLKTASGADPSAADPVRAAFVNASGGFDVLERTSALSVTFSSNSTGGAIANLAFKVCVLLLNNAGVLDMGVVVRPSGIRDNSIVSTTAEGGAGGADSPRVIYSATALTDVRCRVLGYATYTLATPGTWDTAPSEILLTRAGAVETQVKELLYEKTLTADGVFDTNEWWPSGTLPSSGYDSFEIEASCRSSQAVETDSTYLFFNNDTTASNYYVQNALGINGSSNGGEAATPDISCAGGGAPANSFTSTEVKILNPASGVLKTAHAQLATYQATNNILGGFRSIVWRASTAAINQIQFAPDGYNWGTSTGDQFVSGSSLKIYGLKTMTVLS